MFSPLLLLSSSPVVPLFLSFLVCSFTSHSSALLFTGQQAWLAQPLSLLRHACCSRHQALSFLAARSIWRGFMVREGGSPSHFKRITKLHSNSLKALLNILQQVSPPHCISNPLPDSLTTQPGSSIWLFKSPPLGKKCDLQQKKKKKPHMGVYNMTLLLFLLLFFRIFFNICRRFYYFHPIDIFY